MSVPASFRQLIRPGRSEDLLACTAVWRRTVDPALPPPGEPYPLYRHELDTGTLLVAEDGDGIVIGFGASITRGDRWLLSDLFVDPGAHGTGTGRALLDALLAHDRPGPRRVAMGSSDPRALSLYTRRGMTPRWPCFYLAGTDLRPDPARGRGLTVTEVEAADLRALAQRIGHRLEPVDLAYWAATLPLSLVLVVPAGGGDPVAGAVVRWATPFALPHPAAVSLGPVLLAPTDGARADGPEDVLGAMLRWIDGTGRRTAGAPVRVYVPSGHPWLNPALTAGFQITDFDLFCASDPTVVDPDLTCPSHDLL